MGAGSAPPQAESGGGGPSPAVPSRSRPGRRRPEIVRPETGAGGWTGAPYRFIRAPPREKPLVTRLRTPVAETSRAPGSGTVSTEFTLNSAEVGLEWDFWRGFS